jgi:penicillin-binding protein 2
LGIDMPGESRGFIPNTAFYDKIYGEGRWVGQTIISDAIGQGEILATPLQIANLSATIANRGYYITPHVVKNIEGVGVLKKNLERHDTDIDKRYYSDIVEGMRMAVLGGTCTGANIPGLDVCGKTGTAQNPHGRDHSVFMGFAPMNAPKIAVCVYVENVGFGATYGVPIGALMMERYMRGNTPGLQARGRAMASRHTITYPKVKKTTATGTQADKNKITSSNKSVSSDGSKE